MKRRRAGQLNLAVGGRPCGTAPTLVLVHGLGGVWQNWLPVTQELGEHFHLVAVDMPGFGRSPGLPTRTFAFADVADRIADALDELGVTAHAIAGHSTGAGVSSVYAHRHPERVSHLVLVSPAGFIGSGEAPEVSRSMTALHRLQLALRTPLLSMLTVPAVRRRIFGYLVHDATKVSARDALQLALGAQRSRSGLAARAAVNNGGVHRLVRDIDAPTLIIWGDKDRVVSARRGRELAAAFPRGRLEILPDTGHLPMLECGDRVGDLIIEFASGR